MKKSWFFILVVALALPLVAQESANVTPPAVFSKTEDDGILVASSDTWYLEEFDSLGRPIVGTLWKKNVIAEQTSWLYPDDSQQAGTKVVTNATSSVETEYDRAGNVISKITSDVSGIATEIVTNTYDSANRLSVSESVNGDVTTKIEMKYGKNEQKEKRLFQNGMPVITWSWSDDENWTETVYREGEIVLIVKYVNGERKETAYEAKR